MTIRGGAPAERTPAGAGDDLSDLLRRVAARDAAAFAALYKATSAKLYGVVARILTRGDAAADVLQEAYVRVWEKAGEFDPAKGSPLAWMATIARSTRSGGFVQARSRTCPPASNQPPPTSTRWPRGSGRRGFRRSSTVL